MYTGVIYLKDQNDEAVGVGQAITVSQIDSEWAGFLVISEGNVQFTDTFATEALCVSYLRNGNGGGIIVIDDF